MNASTGGVTEIRKLARSGSVFWGDHVDVCMGQYGFEQSDMMHCIQNGRLRGAQADEAEFPKAVDGLKYPFNGTDSGGDDFFLVCKICESESGERFLFIITAHPPKE